MGNGSSSRPIQHRVKKPVSDLDGLIGEVQVLKRDIKQCTKMFPQKLRKCEKNDKKLAQLREKELETMEALNWCLRLAKLGNAKKEEEIQRLTARIAAKDGEDEDRISVSSCWSDELQRNNEFDCFMKKMKLLDKTYKELAKERKKVYELRKGSRKLKEIVDQIVKRERLIELREEKRSLLKTVQGLKKLLCQVREGNAKKEDAAWRLTARILELIAPKEQRTGGGGEESWKEDARNLFPEEIWEKFFGKLRDPWDLWNCYNSCTLFQRILHPWKSTWAFEQALPYLFPFIAGAKLLECRLVCRSWKTLVDQFLQDHPSLRPHNEETCNPRLLPFANPLKEERLDWKNVLLFKDPSDINFEDEDYVSRTRLHTSMGRAAELTIGCFGVAENERNRVLWDKLYTFLRYFRKDIWYLRLFFYDAGEDEADIPSVSRWAKQKIVRLLLVDLAGLVPNLRKLTLERLPDITDEDIDPNLPDHDSRPLLSCLETFEDECSSIFWDLDGMGFISLDLAWRHRLQLGRFNLGRSVPFPVFEMEWPCITELHLILSYLAELDILGKLPEVRMPNLGKLGLQFKIKSYILMKWEWERDVFPKLIRVLNELTTTTRLTTLRLDESFHKITEEVLAPGTPCMAHGLKTLELQYGKDEAIIPHPDYLFLLFLPHLENLNLFYRKLYYYYYDDMGLRSQDQLEVGHGLTDSMPTDDERREAQKVREQEVVEVNKYAYTGQMYMSNLWELLPRLKIFSFQSDVYTRGGYEEYCKKNGADQKEIRNIST